MGGKGALGSGNSCAREIEYPNSKTKMNMILARAFIDFPRNYNYPDHLSEPQ